MVVKLPAQAIGNIAVAKVFSISVLVVAIVVIGVLFFQVMASFFVPLFLAALLVVIFRPPHQWILGRVGERTRLASALTTTLVMLLVLLPAAFVIFIAADQAKWFATKLRTGGIHETIAKLRTGLALDLPESESFRQLDEDFVSIRSPLPSVVTQVRIREAEDIVRFIQTEIGSSRPSEEEYKSLTDDLEGLREESKNVDSVTYADDAVERERARRAYESQYIRADQSRHNWMIAMLGGSMLARLKVLANPSDVQIQGIVESMQDFAQPRVLPLTQRAGQLIVQFLLGLLILGTSLYFFLADGKSMIKTLMRLSPLDDQYELRLLTEFDQISRAVVLASVLSALAQGTLAAIAFSVAGLPMIIFLFITTTFMALVPFLGAASVWVPCVVYLAAVEHRIGAAIGLFIFGAAIISTVDNVIKIYVLQGRSQLHPLLAFLSVFGGIQVFGPIGILVGPMVVVFLSTLLEILNHELEGKPSIDVTSVPGDGTEPAGDASTEAIELAKDVMP